MPNCAVFGCKNHSKMKELNVKFYKFPKNENLAKQWSNACRRKDKINMKNACICSKHFESKCFFTPLKYQLLSDSMPKRFRNLLDDAVPTLFLPKSTIESFNSSSSTCSKRSQRMQAKKEIEDRKAVIDNILADSNYETMGAIQQGCESQVVEIEITPDFIPDRISELTNELQNMMVKMLSMEKEMEELKSRNLDLVNKNKTLNSKILKYHSALSKHFTEGQIKRILNPGKKFSTWDKKDIASAISLRSVSSKAYRYLRKNGYPLPGLSTLRRWALNTRLNPGTQTDVLRLLS